MTASTTRHRQAALGAAERAGVVVTEVGTAQQADAVGTLFDRIWGMPAGAPVLPSEVLRVYLLTGQYLVLAQDAASGEQIAASVGILAEPAGQALHSHVTGAVPAARDRSVGYAIKLDQRAWAAERGLDLISWTFDPLQRRNAWFNLVKLGARPVRYLAEFYGAMPDAVNAGDLSDRLYLHWDVGADAPTLPASRRPPGPRPAAATWRAAGYADLLALRPDGAPTSVDRTLTDSGRGLLVALPADVEALRRTDRDTALAWRLAVRESLTTALAAGYVITTVTRDGCYVLEHGSTPPMED